MIRLALVLSTVLAAGAAAAQGYPTALPLDGGERRAVEARLSTILDYAATDEISRFTLPSGRRVSVRTYPPTRGRNGVPCRGYRMDLEGADGMVAVDGFRCRSAGRAWIIAEPETVVARSDAPRDLAVPRAERPSVDDLIAGGDPFGHRRATPGAPRDLSPAQAEFGTRRERTAEAEAGLPRELDDLPGPGPDGPGGLVGADTETPADAPTGPPPVPRRAPARLAGPDDAPDDAPADDTARPPLQGVVAAALDHTAAPPAASEPARPAQPLAVAAAPTAPTRIAAVDPVAARVVETRPAAPAEPAAEGFAADRRVVDGLRNLSYLRGAGRPTDTAVRDAVDEFARDERFALPVTSDDLAGRLAAAVDRSRTIPQCGGATAASLCVSGN